MTYNELKTLLAAKPSRKLENNTYARREGNAYVITLHATNILTFTARSIVATTGGWNTGTTRDRLNAYLPEGFRVYTKSGLLYWRAFGEQLRSNNLAPSLFTDGDKLVRGSGSIYYLRAQRRDNAKALQLKKQIAAYAQRCADLVPLAEPGNGDCWHCRMIVSDGTDKGKSLGDAQKNADHIRSHIEEGYIVPSLVYNALKERGEGPLLVSAAFGKVEQPSWIEIARRDVRKAVQKFVALRLAGAWPKVPAERSGFAVR